MKHKLLNILDNTAGLLLWIIVAIVTFSFVSMAKADEALTRGERIVALTILGEARGEGKKGMYAVACVIAQRSKNRNLTPAKVCHEPYQFSIWNAGKGKIKKESELYYLWKSPSTPYARTLAKNINKLRLSTVKNADHYCTLKTNPYWAKGKKTVAVINNHKFYRLNK